MLLTGSTVREVMLRMSPDDYRCMRGPDDGRFLSEIPIRALTEEVHGGILQEISHQVKLRALRVSVVGFSP